MVVMYLTVGGIHLGRDYVGICLNVCLCVYLYLEKITASQDEYMSIQSQMHR